jgi:hypothetical protein
VSVLQSALSAISVPWSSGEPREPGEAWTHWGAGGTFSEGMQIDTSSKSGTSGGNSGEVPVYLSAKSLTFAGVSTASAVIAGFVHNAMKEPVLGVSIWTGVIVGVFLILLGFMADGGPRITPRLVLETVGVGVINASLLVITVYGAISVAQTT